MRNKSLSKGIRKQPLSAKHRKFAEIWVETGNASRACRETGFSEETAQDLVKHAGILKYAEEIKTKGKDRAIEKLQLDATWVLSRLKEIAGAAPLERGGYTAQVAALKELATIMDMYPSEEGYQEGAKKFADGTMEVYRAKWLKQPKQLPGSTNVQ